MVRFRLDPRLLAAGLSLALIAGPAVQAGQLCPNGAYVAHGPCTLCPGGRYVGAGSLCSGTPLSGYTVTSEQTAKLVHTSAPRNAGGSSNTTSASGTNPTSSANSGANRAVTCPEANSTAAATTTHCATSPAVH